MIIFRAGELVAEAEHFLTRLALAHDDLCAAHHARDVGELDAWGKNQSAALRESVETIKRSQHHSALALGRTFDAYRAEAKALIDHVRADDAAKADASAAAITRLHEETRSAGEAVLRSARRTQIALGLLKWAVATTTTISIAVWLAGRAAEQREAERARTQRIDDEAARPTRLLDADGPCGDRDWQESHTIARTPDVDCRVWRTSAWRNGDYELLAQAPPGGGSVLRITTTWNGGEPPGEEFGAPDGAAAALSTITCRVLKGTDFRVVTWSRLPAAGRTISVTAIPREKGQTPC